MYRKKNSFVPRVEGLENRLTPSARAVLRDNGVLDIRADYLRGGKIIVSQNPTTNVVKVNFASEQRTQSFVGANVRAILMQGGAGSDYLINKTSITSTLFSGNGSNTQDYLQGGTGTDTLVSENTYGSSRVDLFDVGGQNNRLIGNRGFTSYQVFGGNDYVQTGQGQNLVYAILGTNTINAAYGYGDVITNVTSSVQNININTRIVRFFNPQIANQVATVLQDENGYNILYLNPQRSDGVVFTVDYNNVNGITSVSYTDTNGTQQFSFSQSIAWVASFGGAGDDCYINNTISNVVEYGAGGNDMIIGGFSTNLLKGSSGNDILIGRGDYDDLSANTGNDRLQRMNPAGRGVFRCDQSQGVATTTVVGYNRNRDLLTGPARLV